MHDSRPLEEPQEIQRSLFRQVRHSVEWVMLSIAVLTMGLSFVDHFFSPQGESRSVISLTMCVTSLAVWRLVRRHRLRAAVAILVVVILLVTGWAVSSYGSVRAAAALSLVGAVVLAGTYLSPPALVATTASAIGLLGGLTWSESHGLLPPASMAADIRFWLMGSVIILVVGSMLLHSRQLTDEAHMSRLNQMEERQRLEWERDQSLRRFQRIFLLNPTPLLVLVANTQAVSEINPAFARLFGYRAEELAGRSAGALWADAAQWEAHQRELFGNGRAAWAHVRWRCRDGATREVLVSSQLIEDMGGLLILITVVDAADGAAGTR